MWTSDIKLLTSALKLWKARRTLSLLWMWTHHLISLFITRHDVLLPLRIELSTEKNGSPKKSACAYGANMIMFCSLQTSKEFRVTLLEEDVGSGLERCQKTYKVVIEFAARVVLQRLGHFLAGRQAEIPQETLQVLDIVLRQLSLNTGTDECVDLESVPLQQTEQIQQEEEGEPQEPHFCEMCGIWDD